MISVDHDIRHRRAELALRLRASGDVQGRLEEVGGLLWLLSTVAAERRDARIELRRATCIVGLDLLDGELVDATRTTADGDFFRGSRVVDGALATTGGEFFVAAAAPAVPRSVVLPFDVLLHESPRAPSLGGSSRDIAGARQTLEPMDGRDLARAANVAAAALALAAGFIAVVLGMAGPPVVSAGDPSAAEARALAALPLPTSSNLLEGRFTGAFEPYLADRFPLRRPLLALEVGMRRARGFAPGEGGVVWLGVSPEAMDLGAGPDADLDVDESEPLAFAGPPPAQGRSTPGGASDPEGDVLAAGLDRSPDDAPNVDDAHPSGAARSSGEGSPGGERRHGRARRASTRVSSGILIRDGRAMQGFGGGPTGAPAYARALNAIHEAVRDRATVYAVIVPTAQEFYLPEGSRSRVRRERPNILGTYARLSPGIRTVDAHAELAAHTEENVYFRTDHHWTGLGAYYGYRAFCRAAGVRPVPLERMDRRVVDERWLGSLYRLTRDPDLRERPDRVEIMIPPAHAEVRVPGRRPGQDRVVPLFRERSTGYSVFLGGDYPVMRVRTSTRNGRRAILVKNSYGNAFAVHLVSHYEELVVLDYRYFRGSLLALVDESETPTDLVFMNGALTANSRAHTALIDRLLDGRR